MSTPSRLAPVGHAMPWHCQLRFGLGQQKLSKMNFFGVEFPVWPWPQEMTVTRSSHEPTKRCQSLTTQLRCLMKVADKKDPDETVVDGVAQAFEGQK